MQSMRKTTTLSFHSLRVKLNSNDSKNLCLD